MSTVIGVKAPGLTITGENLKTGVGLAASYEALFNLIAAGTFGRAKAWDGAKTSKDPNYRDSFDLTVDWPKEPEKES